MTSREPLEGQLRAYFEHLEDQGTQRTRVDEPVEFTLLEGVGAKNGSGPHDLQQQQTDKEATMLQKNQTSTPPNRWYAIAAAALLVVGAGVVALWAVGSDDDSDLATGQDASQVDPADLPDTEGASAEDTPGITLAKEVIAAFDRHDADFIESVSTAGMAMSEGGGDADLLVADRVAWDAAGGFRFEVEECFEGRDDLADGTFAYCGVWMSNAWSEAMGALPVMTSYKLELEDGRVVSIEFRVADTQGWSDAWDTFEAFVEDLSPEDHATMFVDDDTVDDLESNALFAKYTDLFVQAMAQN